MVTYFHRGDAETSANKVICRNWQSVLLMDDMLIFKDKEEILFQNEFEINCRRREKKSVRRTREKDTVLKKMRRDRALGLNVIIMFAEIMFFVCVSVLCMYVCVFQFACGSLHACMHLH